MQHRPALFALVALALLVAAPLAGALSDGAPSLAIVSGGASEADAPQAASPGTLLGLPSARRAERAVAPPR